MALSEIDRQLLDRCLTGKPQAWQDFVDRFMGLVVHVVNHTADSRSMRLSVADAEDLVSEVLLAIIANDYRVLRRFRGQSSLATYLTVVARRVVVRNLIKTFSNPAVTLGDTPAETTSADATPPEERLGNAEEVEQMLRRLDGPEAEVVRLFHLEGMSYGEISAATGMPAGSIGPTLTRARTRLREGMPPPPVDPVDCPPDTLSAPRESN
ncbi:MAG: sigma-70 family RNA polymerase sigma factor [Planctomycetota bacterium]